MMEMFPDGLFGEDHGNRPCDQFHTVTALCYALTQLKIVGMMVNQRFPATDFCEEFIGCCHGPAERETHPAFHFLGHERGRSRVHVHAQGAKIGCHISSA